MVLKLLHERSYKRTGNRRIFIFATATGISASLLAYWVTKKKEISNNVLCEKQNEGQQLILQSISSQETFLNDRKTSSTSDFSYGCSCMFDCPSSSIIYNKKFQRVVPKLFTILQRAKDESGTPGLTFGIEKDGELVMKGGIGYSDVENNLLCDQKSVMRIASISKSLTSIAIGKLLQDGLLDLNKPIETYLKDFPSKAFDGEKVQITLKQLCNHTSGIRGYFEEIKEDRKEKLDEKAKRKHAIQISKYGDPPKNSDENYFTKYYKDVKSGLDLFINDPLIYKPDSDYEYSSLAYSLVSRVIEEIASESFVSYMGKITKELRMMDTRVDLNDPLVSGRGRYYNRNKTTHKLQNVPYVDNSYKWSGGGFLSNIDDLLKFGNFMRSNFNSADGFLSKETIDKLLQVNPITVGKVTKKHPKDGYAIGWVITPKVDGQPFSFYHSGGAIGVSSFLLVQPDIETKDPSKGLVVVLMANLQSAGLSDTAFRISRLLEEEGV